MNTLVTGATGFIGSHLCKELIQRGYTVFGLSQSGRIYNIKSLLNKKGFHLQRGDIRDIRILSNMIRANSIKVIFHLAAQLPHGEAINNPFLCFDINARGTLNLLNAAYLNGVDRFIYASSMSVYSEPPKCLPVDEKHPVRPSTIYGVSKLTGELYCNVYSKAMDIVVLRYGGAYGRGQPKHNAIPMFINQALNNIPITIYGDGTQTSDFVYVKDMVQGTILALEKNKIGVYNIGGGEEMSITDIAKQIINFTHSKSEIKLADKDTDRPFRFVLDITKSRKDLGYSPQPFDEGLSQYISEFYT
ncbi:MAG: NAD-dependent epimerase/dehydratase family protein [Methanophagales archaeon]|nr:NAD-dependent epimerase/dehydratase family protein [Methanophagales archaeon]